MSMYPGSPLIISFHKYAQSAAAAESYLLSLIQLNQCEKSKTSLQLRRTLYKE
jgi:hypothetical protein